MITIYKREQCCGCEACANICPKNCINMIADDEGFLYPHVDEDKCVSCGLCEKVCPFINTDLSNEVKYGLAMQAKDKEILKECASGGVYTVLAKHITSAGGYAIGASINDDAVKHTILNDPIAVVSHSSSKYSQSRTFSIYKDTKKILEDYPNHKVLFSGTPCQVLALKNYLGREYDNLYTIDVVCAGVMSPRILSDYVHYMEGRKGSKISKLNFKFKEYGYASFTTKLLFDCGDEYSRSRLTDYLIKVFTAHIADRPSCGACVVKGDKRASDLSIFDCWHFAELTGKEDNDLGHTNVLVRTAKGQELLETYGNCFEIYDVNWQKAVHLDGNMVYGIQKHHQKRQEFFHHLNEGGLEYAIQKNIPVTCSDKIKEKLKRPLYKIGLIKLAGRINKKYFS